MARSFPPHLLGLAVLGFFAPAALHSAPIALRPEIRIRRIMTLPERQIRLAKDPRDNALYAITQAGDISRLRIAAEGGVSSSEVVFSSRDHGVTNRNIQGFDIGPDGAFYLVSNERGSGAAPGPVTVGSIEAESGKRTWSVVSRLDPSLPLDIIAEAHLGFVTDPRDNTRYRARSDGIISQVGGDLRFAPEDHGVGALAGLAIGPEGTFYLTTTVDLSAFTRAIVTRGSLDPNTGGRLWTTLAATEFYPLSNTFFDHLANGVAVSPNGRFVFYNSGSRSTHGEEQNNEGRFPGLREVPLTSAIFRLPADGLNLVLPAGEEALRASGFFFADGVRNSFDLAFNGEGDLFATENGPDSDYPEELNWLRQGRHYGFPWRFALYDNPQQFPDYDPASDPMLTPNSASGTMGFFRNDPTFPPPPTAFTDPVLNLGPDGDLFRDPADGLIKDASDEGGFVASFTPHRSPLGLVFDTEGALADEFKGDGFVFSIGSAIAPGLSLAPDQDLLHLELEKRGDNYVMHATRIADGFDGGPIDAELAGNRLYMIEWNSRVLWEITLPAGATAVEESKDRPLPGDFALEPNYPNPFNPSTTIPYRLGAPSQAELSLYNALGQKIRTLVDARQPAGRYSVQWDGKDQAGRPMSSGTYFYRLEAGEFTRMRPLTLLK